MMQWCGSRFEPTVLECKSVMLSLLPLLYAGRYIG